MITRKLIFNTLIIVSINAYAQNSKFNYWTEFCDCQGEYDSTKVTIDQLQNTFDYLWRAPNIETDPTAGNLSKIDYLSVGILETECDVRIGKLEKLDFINEEFWTQLKKKRVKYYESTCLLRKLTMLAYQNPDTLLSYNLVDSTSVFYRNALIAGGQQLTDAWVKLNEIQKSKNGSPDKVQQKFEEKFNSTSRLEYARFDIMRYGWWNNANRLIPHVDQSHDLKTEFEKLLSNINCDCDEP